MTYRWPCHDLKWLPYEVQPQPMPPCLRGLGFTVFHLGFRRGMVPPIIGGTLSCPPGTQLTRLGISNTHPPQLRVQTESVKTWPVITTIYTSRYQVLCHRCERQTSVIRVFSTVTMAWGKKCDVTIVQWGTSLSEYIRRATWRKVWRATWRIWRATWRTWRATWRSQKAAWRCAMLEMARWNTALSVVFKVGMLAIGQNIIISVLLA